MPNPQDSVLERRLRPIYDYLDTANNKKALQECEKVLRKTPQLQCGRALKALSLLRLNREPDCNAILDKLEEESPLDDSAIVVMVICYRELQQYKKICNLYESAVKNDPTNEENHTQLFMSYVRISEFKSQQLSAMALYKYKQKNPYYCWAVMSVILQATRGVDSGNPEKRTLLLTLAERMIAKLDNSKFQAEQEVQLYWLVLQLQHKYTEILALVDGPMGVKLPGDQRQNRIEPLQKLGRWRSVNRTCKSILTEYVDNWAVWKQYLESVFHFVCGGDDSSEDADINGGGSFAVNGSAGDDETLQSEQSDLEDMAADDTAEKAHEFICKLIETSTGGHSYSLRGPFLARFELCRLMRMADADVASLLGDVNALFVEYFRKFGHKACTVADLRSYLHLVTPVERLIIAQQFVQQAELAVAADAVPESESQMLRHIHALQLSRLCGAGARALQTPEQRMALVTAMQLHAAHGRRQFDEDKLSTDQGSSDAYVLLAAHALFDEARAQHSSRPLIEAIALLGELLLVSPSNFHAKLLAVRFYHILGSGLGSAEMYDLLDVKHVQLDSLGYIHCEQLASLGLINHATALYDYTLNFFVSNCKDNMDHLTYLYKYGSFLKLDEFLDFRQRLTCSYHYLNTILERNFIHLLYCAKIDILSTLDLSMLRNVNCNQLRDNRDLQVYQNWDPQRIDDAQAIDDYVQKAFTRDKLLFNMRAKLQIALLELAAQASGKSQTLKQSVQDLRVAVDQLTGSKIASNSYTAVLPFPSRADAYEELGYADTMLAIFDFTQCYLLCNTTSSDQYSSQSVALSARFESLLATVEKLVAGQRSSHDPYITQRHALERVTMTVELLNAIALAVAVLQYHGSADNRNRGRGAASVRKVVAQNAVAKSALHSLSLNLNQTIVKLDAVLELWPDDVAEKGKQGVDALCDALAADFEALQLDTSAITPIYGHLNYSLLVAVRELRAGLRAKVKLLVAA